MKLNNDALLVQPCPVHGRKPELHAAGLQNKFTTFWLLCPVPGCMCGADVAPTRELAMEEWDAMAYGLTGADGSPDFPLLALESGDDDQPDPFDPESDNE